MFQPKTKKYTLKVVDGRSQTIWLINGTVYFLRGHPNHENNRSLTPPETTASFRSAIVKAKTTVDNIIALEKRFWPAQQ